MDVNMSVSSSPVHQALFIQDKLKKIFRKTQAFLNPYKSSIEFLQDTLVWKKPVFSALLYIALHWLFVIYVKSNAPLVTSIGNIMFWVLLGDVLWRSASKDGFRGETKDSNAGRQDSNSSTSTRTEAGTSALSAREIPVSFDTLLIQRHTPRGPNELPSFNLICLWIAEMIMWLDNLVLALRHWSVKEPAVFTLALIIPGVGLSLIGKYIPTVVFLYLVVMGVVVWPYVEYHSLKQRTLAYVSAQYPGLLRRAKSAWVFLKAITVNRDKSEDPELSLSQGIPDLQTQRSLQEAFEQFTVIPVIREESDELELEDRSPRAGRHRGGPGSQPPLPVNQVVRDQRPNNFSSPSTESLLFDSLDPGIGEFPSITDLDLSLALPQFPSGDNVLSSVMPSIPEEDIEDNVPRRQESNDLDPFLDSVQLEFGGFDFADGRPSRPHPQPIPHPLSTTYRAQPIDTQPSAPPLESGYEDSGRSTGQTSFMHGQPAENHEQPNQYGDQTQATSSDQREFTPNFLSPPTYQQVESGSPDAGVTVECFPQGTSEWAAIPQRSSTPDVQDSSRPAHGLRQRPKSDIY